MSTSKVSLIPQAKTYIENGFNVLLIGDHGVGKTESIMAACKELGLKFKSYSCSTLDPFTDLVGVPIPKNHDNRDYLHMIRPSHPDREDIIDLDDAEVVFFDEFSRGDPKVMNALFEIVQFRTINGEPLPNLRSVWAAMNPPNQHYYVEEVDPALLDRFDQFIELKPKVSVAYMVASGIPEAVAQAAKSWWDGINQGKRGPENYVSPRRLMKVCQVYMATKNKENIRLAFLPSMKVDAAKLGEMIEIALGKREAMSGNFGDPPPEHLFGDKIYPGKITSSKPEYIKWLKEHPQDLESHLRIVEIIFNKDDRRQQPFGANTLIKTFKDLLDVVNPSVLESNFKSLGEEKKTQMRKAMAETPDKDNFPNLLKVLKEGKQKTL